MNPAVVDQIASMIAGLAGITATFSFAALCFPSIRGGVAEWLSNRGLRNADAAQVSAELAALRGEVYALRAELATVARSLPVPAASNAPRIGPGVS